MYEKWQLGLLKGIKAVRLFGLTLVSGDTAALSIPDGEKKPNLLYWKRNLNQQKQDMGIIELLSAVSRDFLLLRPAGFNHFE